MNEKIHFGFAIEREIWEKFKYIAEHEFRSNTGQLVHIIKENIAEFEKEHGEIDTKTMCR